MSFAEWSLAIGALMFAMVLVGTLLGRLPLTSAMVYLALGAALGPLGADVLRPDPVLHARLLGHVAEAALLISLFAVGLRLGVPLRDRRWRLPLRLAFGSMTAMVALVAAVGVFALDLSWGAGVLLGAILAPTDPVLASGLPSEPGPHPDRLGFSLAGEGGLNDGAAYPFVILGLALLTPDDPLVLALHWLGRDLLWATAGGLAVGGTLGAVAGHVVVRLRSRHGEAVGLDVFLGLGLLGMAYGLAQALAASGFLAAFAAGLALQRVHPAGPASPDASASIETSATMRGAVQGFNEQLERLAEMLLVVLVGAMLAYAKPLPAVLWFVPLVLLALRPATAWWATRGEPVTPAQRRLIGWFGIRGIGSVYYLLFVLGQGLEGRVTDTLVTLTLWTVAASIVAHGLSAQPLMQRYLTGRG